MIYSSDKQLTGIYRALIVEANDAEARVYIPAFHRDQMPFQYTEQANPPLLETDDCGRFITEEGTLAMKLHDYPLAQLSSWRCRPELNVGDAVWICFENGDANYPVIIGYLGNTLDIYTGSGLFISNGGSAFYNGEYYEGLPTYKLSESAIRDIATAITGETGGSDTVACRQEASQIANLNEVTYGRSATEDGILKTLHSGWYSPDSWTRGCTDVAIQAVRDCLVNGRRILPRYVTEHDTFPNDIINAKSRNEYKRGDSISNIYGSNYQFYCFFGSDGSGDISGYFARDYEKYKSDDTRKKRSSSAGNDSNIVKIAQSKLGCPYIYGATGPDSFDCSGFCYWVYQQIGISLPRTSQDQYAYGTSVDKANLQPGDLVFFTGSDGSASAPGHVGIYIGDGEMIHAPNSNSVVKIVSISSGYYSNTYVGARRVSK